MWWRCVSRSSAMPNGPLTGFRGSSPIRGPAPRSCGRTLMCDDAAQAAWLAVTVPLHGFHTVFVAAPDTFAPYLTADLLRAYHPDARGACADAGTRCAAGCACGAATARVPGAASGRGGAAAVVGGARRIAAFPARFLDWPHGAAQRRGRRAARGSTPTSSSSVVATGSGHVPTRRPPDRSAAIRGTWRRSTRPRSVRFPDVGDSTAGRSASTWPRGRIERWRRCGPRSRRASGRSRGSRRGAEDRGPALPRARPRFGRGAAQGGRRGQAEGPAGLGEKTVKNIRHGIEQLTRASAPPLLNTALDLAEDLVAEIGAVPGCKKCDYAGSLRRMRETVGDIDILATATDSAPLMAALLGAAGGRRRDRQRRRPRPRSGPTRGCRSTCGSCRRRAAGARRCIYFTGSQAHNIRLAGRAVQEVQALRVRIVRRGVREELVVSRTEEELYHGSGLPWIPPPLREDRGEIEAAARRAARSGQPRTCAATCTRTPT